MNITKPSLWKSMTLKELPKPLISGDYWRDAVAVPKAGRCGVYLHAGSVITMFAP
jgi:hypothetical protein